MVIGIEKYQTLTHLKKILQELKNAIYHDLEDLFHRMGLTYYKMMDALDIKYFPSERTGYTLQPGIYEVSDINKTLEYILHDFVKVNFTIDDIRLRSNLKINPTLIFTKKSFIYTIL